MIDEAHHFEEVASKHLGLELYYGGLASTLTWLFKDSHSGQLPQLSYKLESSDDENASKWQAMIDDIYPKLVKIKEEWDALSEQLFALVSSRSDPLQGEGQFLLRIKKDQTPSHWPQLQGMEDNIFIAMGETVKQLEKLLLQIKEAGDGLDVQGLITDLGGNVKQLYRHREALHFFYDYAGSGVCVLAGSNPYGKSKSLMLTSVPSDVSPMLKQLFFDVKESIVMTSATLSVDKSFQYASEQLGVGSGGKSDKLVTLQLPSPFNYREQALVCIPGIFRT